jgi:hypothetical protein
MMSEKKKVSSRRTKGEKPPSEEPAAKHAPEVIRSAKLFVIVRDEDESGISGIGVVAEGVEFTDGVVIVHWLSHTPSTNIYANMKQCTDIHGHGGKTRIVWEGEADEQLEGA